MRTIAPLVALSLTACTVAAPEVCEPAEAALIDVDQDGYVAVDDCNDNDPTVHPGAFDDCDGVDNDCNGEVDEGYPDVDGNGFADCETEELCNGVDDDGDGAIDEGFEDLDADGLADCLDDSCDVDLAAGGEVTIDEDCQEPDIDITDPWDVGIEWQYTVTSGSGVIVMPAVGNLTDDNGDGAIDDKDNPDIVFTTWGANQLVALHGDGSGTIFTATGYDGNCGVTIADVDNDGESEIIACDTTDHVVAVDGTGAVKWRSAAFPSMQYYPQPTVADLDGDGDVEVIMDVAVVDGTTGSTIATLATPTVSWRTPVVADIDDDGTMEIILGEKVFSHTGALEWSSTRSGDSSFAAVADIDGDSGGEVFFVSGNYLYIHDDDGTLLQTQTLFNNSRPGPPSVADFDGDGDVEVAIPANSRIGMYEIDGTLNWSAAIRDSSGIAGCSGYDINGDGAYELLYADEISMRIFDGVTGAELYANSSHTSGTLWEYPVIADVDNDGSAEIVIASNGSIWKGITVFGHNGSGWAKAGPTWPTHDFAVTNINPDGSVPTGAPHSWDVHNVFRARPVTDTYATDLAVEITDVCVSSCDPFVGTAEVAVQVWNQGATDLASDVEVAIYRQDGATFTWVASGLVPGPIAGGASVDGISILVPVADLGDDGLVARVDDVGDGSFDDGLVTECDESNNSDTWPYDVCP